MNRYILTFLFLILSTSLVKSEDEKKSEVDKVKIYSQEEFDKKLEDEVVRRLAKVTGDSLQDFAKSLLDKENEINSKQEDLKKREQELSIIEKGLQDKLKEFRNEQEKIIGCMSENEKKSSQRIDHIVKVISGMKPANAAEVLTVQDSSISVQIISKLNPDKVSKIFNLMDKEISARLQKSYINMKK